MMDDIWMVYDDINTILIDIWLYVYILKIRWMIDQYWWILLYYFLMIVYEYLIIYSMDWYVVYDATPYMFDDV